MLTLFIHYFVSVTRLINDNIEVKTGSQIVLFLIGSNMIWFSLYYFTCELLLIKNSLSQDDHLSFQRQKRFIQITKYTTFIIILLFSASNSVIQYYVYTDMSYYKANMQYFNLMLVISRTVKILVDLYFHFRFFQLYLYLIKQRELLSKQKQERTIFQKFIKASIVILFLASLFHALLIFYSTFELMLDPNYTTSQFNRFFLFTVFLVVPVKDFFIALLFAYLYYNQGRKFQIQKFNDKLKSGDSLLSINDEKY